MIIDEAVTLVPDLYRGKIATDHETAGHYMSDLDWSGAVQDIAGAAKYLKEKGWPNISLKINSSKVNRGHAIRGRV